MRDHLPVVIQEFNGTFDRGSDDVVPIDHFIDSQNVLFTQLGCGTRKGFTLNTTLANIRRVHLYTRINAAQRLLILDSAGNIFDATASLTIPIWTDATFTDFSVSSQFGRAYITPHDRTSGISGKFILVYSPDFTFGAVLTVTLVGGGAGYTVNDILTLNAGGVNATLKVLTLGGGGAVATFSLQTRGSGYQVATPVGVTGGTGAAATFNISAIFPIARLAGGTAPSGAPAAANSASAGNVEAGQHLFKYVYETDSGFITQGSPSVSLTASGAKKVDLSSISVGPSGTIARHALATKIIQNYSGREDDYEFFFVPNGKISNNTATTETVDFFDNDLQASADYLLDQLANIPAGVYIGSYQGSLVSAGEKDKESVARVSKPGEPESVSSIDGFLLCNPGDAGSGIKNGIEYRDLFYLQKSQKTYVTKNNGSAPATWDVNLIDSGIGTECFGVSVVLDALGNTQDRFIIADRSGLCLFIGTYSDKPLSWKIYDIWKRINQAAFSTIQVKLDPVEKLIYVNIPLDAATEPSHVIVFDYKNGLDPQAIRQTIWKLPNKVTSIHIRGIQSGIILPRFEFASSDGNVYHYDTAATDDYGTAIDSYGQSALAYHADDGAICHFNLLRFRIKGTGTLLLTLSGEDGVVTANPPSITLASSPGKEINRLINFVNERMSVKWRTNAVGEFWSLNRLIIGGAPIYNERPQ